ncbi:MAG: hypothetical protein H0X46_06310 [Bacteroidetes bacterium]|nr:hypothetical protein [Bacteroidota bacterium]
MSDLNDQINFKVSRDFGETFNISIKFLRQNFRSFFVCLLLVAGPFILLYSFTSAHYQSVIMHKTALVQAGRLYNINIYNLEYFMSLLAQFISLLSLMCTTYSYMLVSSEKGAGNVTVKEVIKKLNEHLVKIAGGFFLFFVLTVIIVVAITFLVGMIVSSLPVLGVFLVLGLFVALLLLGPNILWQLNTSFLVILAENEMPFFAYGRTRELMKGNYWWTWLIIVCNVFLISFLSLLFLLPTGIYSLIKIYTPSTGVVEETSMIYIIILATCSFLATAVYSIFYIISGFHYFSLTENKDGAGLMERINEIGKAPKINTEQQF